MTEGDRSGRRARRSYSPPEALLERYEYERDLQPGSQAGVLLCRDRSNGEHVAIKFYVGDGIIDPTVFTALEGADSRHVVPSRLEHGDGYQWEVMEYFPLGSLHEVLHPEGGEAPPTFSPLVVREFVTEMAAALEFIHSRGVVHRDLKPANILVRSLAPLDVVIGDFGVSIQTAATAAATVRGTWAYAPPEASYGEVSARSDWWPLGIMTYELLTGHHPLADPVTALLPGDERVRHAIGRGEVRVDGVADERWRLLLSGLLTYDAAQRWGGREVAAWLEGKSPRVARNAGPTAPERVTPFVLADRAFTDPVALTRASIEHWQEATERLAGRDIDKLRALLVDTGTEKSVAQSITGRSSPSAVLLAMQAAFTPDAPLMFQGRALTGPELEKVASAAQRGDAAAARWIGDLRRAGILGEASRYVNDGAALAVADDRLRAWWRDVANWEDRLSSSDVADRLPELRARWEGQLLLAALDDGAGSRLRDSAAADAGKRGPVPAWATALQDKTRLVTGSSTADTGTATVALSVLDAARAIEDRDRRAAEAAEEAEREAAREAEELRRRTHAQALLLARRRRAAPEFWVRLWLVGVYTAGAAVLSNINFTTWNGAWSWDTARDAAIVAGLASLTLSLAVFLWETFVDRVRLFARSNLLVAAGVVSLALLWVEEVKTGLASPIAPRWWITPPLVFAIFFLAAVILSSVLSAKVTTAALYADDNSWANAPAPRRLQILARWTTPVVGIAGIVTVSTAAALGITLAGQTLPALMSTGGVPTWLYDVGVNLDAALPDAPMASGSSERLFVGVGILVFSIIALRLYRDLAPRARFLAGAVLVVALLASIALVLLSPWELVLAGFLAASIAIAGVVIGVVLWIVLAVMS